jgi:protoporphyrinogen oxidase
MLGAIRLFRRACALALAISLLNVAYVPTAGAEIASALESRIGRFLLLETAGGRSLVESLLGSGASRAAGRSEQVAEVLARLRAPRNRGLAAELESRIEAIEARFQVETGLGRQPRALARLTAAEKEVLERISQNLLDTRVGAGSRVEFVVREGGYARARDLFRQGESVRPPLRHAPLTRAQLAEFKARYGVDASEVRYTPKNGWPGIVKGLPNSGSLAPQVTGPVLEHPGAAVDEVVIGSGPAGLTAGTILSDSGRRVLVLEAADELGGLAAGGRIGNARFGRGAAYYAAPGRDQYRLMQRLGLGNYRQVNGIQNNIDSLLMDGKLYPEFWEHAETLEQLPRSFKLYKHFVERIEGQGLIANQPIEEAPNLWLDQFTAKEVVERIPEMVSKWKDAASREIYAEFLADPRIDRAAPMKDLFRYLDPYGRSALGATTEHVNAMAFFNFQSSEIVPRYTGATGTGELAERFVRLLGQRPHLVQLQASSPVAKIIRHADHLEILYVRGGQTYRVRAQNVVFTAPMKLAPKLIQGFERMAPAHARALRKIPYTDYIVTAVETEGHVTRGTYDFWFGDTNNRNLWVTDMIDGRFQELGHLARPDSTGILTFYRPMGAEAVRTATPEQIMAAAEEGIEQAQRMIGPYLKMQWGTEIQPKWVVASTYPASIQVVTPGYFKSVAPVFRQPIGDAIYPAGIVNGTPSLEEAMYSGQRAAEDILKKVLARR